ncbi:MULTISPECIES: nicotinamide mononucleotide transporter family protein [unclassified Streptomyces]|uniref:nicotinamide mononucleotide transporter family protein n=1 Tax=unclassified Streptomyces TaxID=2593676 RepID=UPI000DAC95B7|nr:MULTISPECIES: nicotinamide mononucleotide transporter family protein [unclassified Streptomyces]PZT76657.1 nicotinamide riboside transporter PnuC [Streptomyces sp. AC1-42W]PZT79387.1 nicotinamide riboside transporter PnuC [Streptomyces sp. AC1-42T]
MSALEWLNQQFDLFGIPVYWSDFLGNILALATVWLALKRSLTAWPVQILGSVLLLIASLNVHLGGNAARQVVIIISASWGWATWKRSREKEGSINVRWASGRERLVLIAAMALGTFGFSALLNATDASFYPGAPMWMILADAWIFIGSILAMYTQARRYIEFWFVWLAVDLVGVPLAIYSELYFSGIVYAIFFVMVVMGIRDWASRSKGQDVSSPMEPTVVLESRTGASAVSSPAGGRTEPEPAGDARPAG